MASWRRFCLCTRLHLNRLLFNRKAILAAILLVFFSSYVFAPITTLGQFYGMAVPPWLMPFFMSMSSMVILHGALILLLFSDVGSVGEYDSFVLVRSGRRPFVAGQFAAVFVTSLVYTLAVFLCSVVFILPVLGWDTDWGVILRTMAESSGKMRAQTGVSLSIDIPSNILSLFTPLEAMGMTALCMTVSSAFLGCVMTSFRLLFNKNIAFCAGSVLVGLSVFAKFLGNLTYGKWLQFVSPLTWANIIFIDWYQSGLYPGPAYVFTFWGAGLVLMIGLSLWRVAYGDVHEEAREP